MTGIIDAASRGTYLAPDGGRWIYYQDFESPQVYYVLPVPTLAVQNGLPAFRLTRYTTAGVFTSASLQLTTTLSTAPVLVQQAIANQLSAKISKPTFQAMPYISIGASDDGNRAHLSFASADGACSRTAMTMPSLSGSQPAIFDLSDLSFNEADFLQRYFGGDQTAGTVEVSYELSTIARMDGVTAIVRFDASSAYEYQRTFKWVN